MSVSISSPLTCEAVRLEMSSLVGGWVDAEMRGRIHGHLAMCADCATELARRKAKAIAGGEISKPAEARVERITSTLFPIRKSVHATRIGMMWQRGTSCRTLPADDRRIMDRARRRLKDAVERSRELRAQSQASGRLRGAVRTRGSAQPFVRLPIEVLGTTWELVTGEPADCRLVGSPMISAEGEFRMAVELSGETLLQCRGRVLICTLSADEEKLAFESLISVERVEFQAEDLPRLGGVTTLDPSWVRLYLAPRGYSVNA